MSGRQSTAFFVVLTCSLVLYVYRFFVVAANVSLFRLVLLTWMAMFAVDVVRRRVHLGRKDWLFVALCGVLIAINAADFTRLDGYPNLRRDIFNHLANLCLTAIVALTVRTAQDLNRLLHAFIGSSVLAAGIALFTAVNGHLPLESLIRAGSRDLTRHDNYVNDDLIFRRETSGFLDPNFYGIYCVLVLLCIMYSWLYVKPSKTLAILFVLNLVCLDLTLSRTAVAGLAGGLGLAALVERRVRLVAPAVVAAAILLLPAATMVQSHAYRGEMAASARQWLSAMTPASARGKGETASGTPPASARGKGETASSKPQNATLSAKVVSKRAVSSFSLSQRLPYITNALDVIRRHPLVGGGAASLLIPKVPWASAHVSYLSLLARFGVLGALPYFVFIVFPLVYVLLRRSQFSQGPVFLVVAPLTSFLVVYLSYDVFFSFELQYLFFGIAYSVVLADRAFRAAAQPDRALSLA